MMTSFRSVIGGLIALTSYGLAGFGVAAEERSSAIIEVGARELQQVIAEAPPHSTLVCDRNRLVTVSAPIEIRKPLTLIGLKAQLPPKLGKSPLLVVKSRNVTLLDFELTGNGDSVPQDQRAPLIVVAAGEFRIERMKFFNSSKDGINVDADAAGEDIVGGVIRDIVGRKVIRDTVSISGGDPGKFKVKNVLVDNVRAYDSQRRGAVEVSDGSEHVTVRKVYAERCIYAVDVQDHSKPPQINRHIVVEDIHAVRSKHAIRTSNRPLGHVGLTIRDVTAEHCNDPIVISNTRDVALYNIRVIGHEGAGTPVLLKNCHGLTVRDVIVEKTTHQGVALAIDDCSHVVVNGVTVRDATSLAAGVRYRVTTDATLSDVRISQVSAREVREAGIVFETTGEKRGTLTDYVVRDNLATVKDGIRGARAQVEGERP
jgi:hypothetical protein